MNTNASHSPSESTCRLLQAAAPSLSVGVLSADLLHLGDQLGVLEEAGVHLAHVDVMDGCFVPPLTVGPVFIKAMKTRMLKDVHLMIRDPLDHVDEYVAAGADIITVHVESSVHVHRVLQALGRMTNANDEARGLVRGVALNPGTPVEAVIPLLDEIDLVTLLAINPGWSGQHFLPSTFERLARLRHVIAACGRRILVAVDGGITRENIGGLAGCAVDIVVTGSAVFSGDPAQNLRTMTGALAGHTIQPA